MMKVLKFFHKLFKPNCDCAICVAPVCPHCYQMELLIESINADKRKLLDVIVELSKPITTVQTVSVDENNDVARGARRTWSRTRQELEHSDKLEAERIRAQEIENKASKELRKKTVSDSITELEKELGITGDELSHAS